VSERWIEELGFRRRTAQQGRQYREGRSPMRRDTRRPGRLPGGLQALPEPPRAPAPEGANCDAERSGVLNYRQYPSAASSEDACGLLRR